MLNDTKPTAHASLRRGRTQLAERKAHLTPFALFIVTAMFCILGISGACYAEYYASGIAFTAAFPADGAALTDDLQALRLPLIACLLIGGAMIHAIPGRAKKWLDWLTHSIAFWAILFLLFGVGLFVGSTVFLTLGSGEEQTLAGSYAGIGLALASLSMFSLSFAVCHVAWGKLFGVVPAIVKGLTERRRLDADGLIIREAEVLAARIEAGRNAIAEMDKRDALARKAATEAGVIAGEYQAIAHDLVASREAMGDVEVGPDDEVHVPQVPLKSLQVREAEIARYSFEYFLTLILKHKKG
jgi:hypothetical protein